MPKVCKSMRRQRGAATLLVTLLLTSLILVVSMTGSRVAVMETKTTGAEARLREVKAAAEAGLEYGIAWLRANKCAGGCAGITAPRVTTPTGYTFDPSVAFSDMSGYLLVTSTATANEDASINAISQQVVKQLDLLTPAGQSAPPIVVDGCLTSPKGNPKIYPRPGGPAALTLATTNPGDGTSAGCLDLHGPGSGFHFELGLCASGGSASTCAPGDTSGAATIDESDIPDYLAGVDLSAEAEPRAWNYLFTITLSEAKARAAAVSQVYASDNSVPTGSAPQVPFVVYTGSTPFNGSGSKVYGSAGAPIVLIVTDGGCPKFNGGVTVYGFIYYESVAGSCNGWGGANVIGSVILENDAGDFNANSNFFDSSNIGGGGGGLVFLDDVARLFGTWKDW